MSRRIISIPVCAAAALAVWVALPGTGADRELFSLTAKTFAAPNHFVTGNGTSGEPFTLHSPRRKSADLTDSHPTEIIISDDPGNVFQDSPPSPVDFAVILKNLRSMGRESVAIGMPLSFPDPDVLSLAALDQQLGAFPSAVTSAPLSRSPIPTPIPPAFRRASIALASIAGDPSLLPKVDRVSLPDILLGNGNSRAGFTTLESEKSNSNPHLLARWEDRAVLSLHLLAALQGTGSTPSDITVRLGEWISLGATGPYVPIDEFGRLTAKPPEPSGSGVPAETLIDAPDDILAETAGRPVVIRNGMSASDPAAAEYSESLVPTVAMISALDGSYESRKFPRLPWFSELLLVASVLSLLFGFGNYPTLSRKGAPAALAVLLVALHFILVPAISVWIPTLPLIACALAAIPFAARPLAPVEKPEEPMQETLPTTTKIPVLKTHLERIPPIPVDTYDQPPARIPTEHPSPPAMNPAEKADALIEALPYLQAFRSKTILIKMGGSAMENPELVANVMRDIVFLEVAGINPIVVHGGGKAISAAMEKAGIEAKFINGLRYTSEEAIGIVSKVLSDEINPGLVRMIRDLGGKATGIPGTDIFLGEKLRSTDSEGNPVDLGRVGEVVGCQLGNMDTVHKAAIVPVISPLASELGTGKPLNINADLAAAALAKELRVSKLVYLSDVPGLLSDPKDPSTLIKSINRAQADALIADGTISGGMIPKVRSAVDALNAGVRKVHFVDGRLPHALLLEIFTDGGIGTEVTR